MRFIKDYKIFESDGDLEFPTLQDVEEIETFFLEIVDEFDLEKDTEEYYAAYIDKGYYNINITNENSLRINFNLDCESHNQCEKLLDLLKEFNSVVKRYFPEVWISYKLNRVKVKAFDMFRNSPERNDIIHVMFLNKNKGTSNLFQIEII